MNVLTYGTFDLLHIGHIRLLKRAKKLGDKLFVGLSTDEFNLFHKNKESIYSFKDRKEILKSLIYVDFVFPEDSWLQKEIDVKKYKIDVFVIGDDWKGKFDYLKKYCKVVYLPRTKFVSTSKTKELIKNV